MNRRISTCLLALLTAGSPALAQSPAEAKPDLPAVVSLFTDIARDLRHLASRDSILILGAAGAASLAVKPEDPTITLRASHSQPLDTALDGGAVIGDGATRLGADLLQAQLVSGLLTQTIKYAVNRTRQDGGHHSFPSGHGPPCLHPSSAGRTCTAARTDVQCPAERSPQTSPGFRGSSLTVNVLPNASGTRDTLRGSSGSSAASTEVVLARRR